MKRMVSILTGNVFPTESRELENLLKKMYSEKKYDLISSPKECIKLDILGDFIIHLDLLKTNLWYNEIMLSFSEYGPIPNYSFALYIKGIMKDTTLIRSISDNITYSGYIGILMSYSTLDYSKKLLNAIDDNAKYKSQMMITLNKYMQWSSYNECNPILVRTMIKMEKYHYSESFSRSIMRTSAARKPSILKALLEDGCINPCAYKSKYGRYSHNADRVIKRLGSNLSNPPTTDEIDCLKLLYKNKWVRRTSCDEIIDYLKDKLKKYDKEFGVAYF